MKTIAAIIAPAYHQTTTKEKPMRSDKVLLRASDPRDDILSWLATMDFLAGWQS